MRISMVITTCNRGHLLVHALERLTALTLPDELLIVDDGGSDFTQEVALHFSTKGLPIQYLYHDNPGPSLCSQARNIGVRHANNPWIVTTEPELVFATDVLAQFERLHEQHPKSVISTGTVPFLEQNGTVKMVADRWVAPFAGLYGAGWLEEVGGWDEEFPGPWGWDDTDLLTRLRLAGHGQVIAPEVVAVHQWHPQSGDHNSANERYFMAKSFHKDESDHTDLVANKGRGWGKLRRR